MIPPPTPKSAEKRPATRPMATRRIGVSYERDPAATPAERERARDRIDTGGLIVAGRIAVDEDAGPAGQGRVLVVTQLYVSASR